MFVPEREPVRVTVLVSFKQLMILERVAMTNEGNRKPRFYTCNCFTTDNIFLDEYRLHVRFVSEQQFKLEYRALLRKLGCGTDRQFEDVLHKVFLGIKEVLQTHHICHAAIPAAVCCINRRKPNCSWNICMTDVISQEVDRRQRLDVTSAERVAAIKDVYQPLHPHVYHLQESYLAPEFKQILEYCQSGRATEEGLLGLLEEQAAPRVYRFPVFKKSFCEELVEELEHFEQSAAPKGRPNTMNHYGILLNELDFDEGFITPLREQYLMPLTSLLYPDCGGCCLDSHKAFVVKYDMNEDLDLSYHYDNAEITLNVSLGKEFTEGNLYFGDMRQVPVSETECSEVEHRVTEGLLHRGQHMHGALPISSGQRWNLIIWMRASQERNKLCPMCNRTPSLVEAEGFADGFTKQSEPPQNISCALT